MKNKPAGILLATGAVLVAFSLFLFQDGSASDRRAGEAARELLARWETPSLPPPSPEPGYTGNASSGLPEQVLGVLSAPSLGLELPVLEETTEELLELAPCRYAGRGPEESGLVIAGHSYESHFGRLSHLEPGDEVLFRDRNGGETRYLVSGTEFLPGDGLDALDAAAWDLTLFTCTFDGSDRLLVRCSKSGKTE